MKGILIAGAAAVLGFSALPVWAALGGAPSWPDAPRTPGTRLMAAANNAAPYTVTTATQESGTVIHEYLDARGNVFAVSWRGPRIGSMDVLLGGYFPAWQKGLAAVQASRGGGYGPVAMRNGDLVVETGGHMGALTGRAWLPLALPQGFDASQIQ
ncbi:DUF2844 domain-containing protein [Paraburkholderia sp. Ac-20340]|uniref:DUF2844 domain-containing protein n=1 Tax=Paraburkholderia sp. Ac-20340 TaxID=2703888 RepID=UPI00197F2F12|nr:DUF2844 domain-containing protein [Paraburkholderia sp. Ac-20340]MBN3856535.1 DUF2844 domain-containing protein [Paraburkholderia sp. Ac-20340]